MSSGPSGPMLIIDGFYKSEGHADKFAKYHPLPIDFCLYVKPLKILLIKYNVQVDIQKLDFGLFS